MTDSTNLGRKQLKGMTMKLRIRGDSIRFRLGKSEIQQFLREGSIEEVTHFPGPGSASLAYRLKATSGEDSISCLFENHRLTVYVPGDTIRRWATVAEVSIHGAQRLDDCGMSLLRILIEKDLECLHGSEKDDNEDAFANPHQNAVS